MDDLDRLYRRLIHNIRATHPEYLQIPFTVQELYEQLVPYRHNRRDLAIETNQDYETAIARLLSGERGYVRTDPALQEALQRELNSPTGDPGIFKDHAQEQLTLGPVMDHLVTPVPPMTPVGGTPVVSEHPGSTHTTATQAFDAMSPGFTIPSATPISAGATPTDAPTTPASVLASLSQASMPTGCRFCGGTLPDGREVHYCPHCGENLRTQRCPACGAEMDTSWNFCVTCGRRA